MLHRTLQASRVPAGWPYIQMAIMRRRSVLGAAIFVGTILVCSWPARSFLYGWSEHAIARRSLRGDRGSAAAHDLAHWRQHGTGRPLTKVPMNSVGVADTALEVASDQDIEGFLAELQATAYQGSLEDVEDMLYDQIDEGIPLDVSHYNFVIKACGDDCERAQRWVFRMKALGVQPNAETQASLIRAVGRQKGLAEAENMLLQVLDTDLQPSAEMFEEVLSVIEEEAAVTKVELWVEKMMNAGHSLEVATVNKVLGTFAKAGKPAKVQEWMAIAEKNLGLSLNADSFAVALGAFAQVGHPEGGEQLMEEMVLKGVAPNAKCYVALLKSEGKPRAHKKVQHWTEALRNSSVELSAQDYVEVLDALAAFADHQRVDEWVEHMLHHGKASPEALAIAVEVYLMSGKHAGGLSLAKERVQQFQDDGGQVTQAVHAALAVKEVVRGEFRQVEKAFGRMQREGLEMNEDSVRALLIAYGNARPPEINRASDLLREHVGSGQVEATPALVEALHYAVGGSRCLRLRRELQLADQSLAGPEVVTHTIDRMVMGYNKWKENPRNRRSEEGSKFHWRPKLKWS